MITAESKISDVTSKIPNHLAIFRKYWNTELDEARLKYYGMLKIQFYADQDGWDNKTLENFLKDCNDELAKLKTLK